MSDSLIMQPFELKCTDALASSYSSSSSSSSSTSSRGVLQGTATLSTEKQEMETSDFVELKGWICFLFFCFVGKRKKNIFFFGLYVVPHSRECLSCIDD